MEIFLDKRAVRQIRLSAQDAIEEGDIETLREDILEAFTEEQVEEIERRLDNGDFFEFLTDLLDEWSGDDADELLELLDTQLGDVGVDLKFEKRGAAPRRGRRRKRRRTSRTKSSTRTKTRTTRTKRTRKRKKKSEKRQSAGSNRALRRPQSPRRQRRGAPPMYAWHSFGAPLSRGRASVRALLHRAGHVPAVGEVVDQRRQAARTRCSRRRRRATSAASSQSASSRSGRVGEVGVEPVEARRARGRGRGADRGRARRCGASRGRTWGARSSRPGSSSRAREAVARGRRSRPGSGRALVDQAGVPERVVEERPERVAASGRRCDVGLARRPVVAGVSMCSAVRYARSSPSSRRVEVARERAQLVEPARGPGLVRVLDEAADGGVGDARVRESGGHLLDVSPAASASPLSIEGSRRGTPPRPGARSSGRDAIASKRRDRDGHLSVAREHLARRPSAPGPCRGIAGHSRRAPS